MSNPENFFHNTQEDKWDQISSLSEPQWTKKSLIDEDFWPAGCETKRISLSSHGTGVEGEGSKYIEFVPHIPDSAVERTDPVIYQTSMGPQYSPVDFYFTEQEVVDKFDALDPSGDNYTNELNSVRRFARTGWKYWLTHSWRDVCTYCGEF